MRLTTADGARIRASQARAAAATACRSVFKPWSPATWTTVRRTEAGGIPNRSLVPCTTNVGTVTASSSPSRLGAGAAPARRGGCNGNARHNTATAPVAVAVRHATRAPAERPPTTSGNPRISSWFNRATTAVHAASS